MLQCSISVSCKFGFILDR